MKVIVQEYLNVRVGQASLNAPCYQYLAPGSELEVDGKLYQGDLFEGVDTWLKDEAGNYYWSGGVSKSQGLINLPPTKINWKENFIGLLEELKFSTGKGITIAIIDSGVDLSHPDILSSISLPKDFTQNTGSMTDIEGHGTAIAGIICARSKNEKGIIGVAPDCKIIPIKIKKDPTDVSQLANNISLAIQYSIDNNADIINISQDFSHFITIELTELIKKASQKGIILIASAGDVNELTEIGVSYPGRDPHFISIGATNAAFEKAILDKHPQRLDFLGGLKSFWTISNKAEKYKTVNGSSFCAAFLSGLSALILSKMKKEAALANPLSRDDFIKVLSKHTTDIDQLYKENFFSFIKL